VDGGVAELVAQDGTTTALVVLTAFVMPSTTTCPSCR
jgi:hypothetical protein